MFHRISGLGDLAIRCWVRFGRAFQTTLLGRWVAVSEEVLEAFLVGEVARDSFAGKCRRQRPTAWPVRSRRRWR